MNNDINIDLREASTRLFKYVFHGVIVGLFVFLVLGNNNLTDVVMTGLIASTVFAMTELYAPSIENSTIQSFEQHMSKGIPLKNNFPLMNVVPRIN